MISLRLIGYWRSKEDLELPDPAWFVDDKMTNSDRQIVIDYLKAGLFMPYASAGVSWCRFRCAERFLGSGEQTDGVFVWPEKLWHYVDKHNVRLPDEFIDYVKENNEFPKAIVDEYEINTDWWLTQNGQNTETCSFLTMDSDGEVNISFSKDLSVTKRIAFLRKLEQYKDKSMNELKTLIESGIVIKFLCKWTEYRDMLDTKIEGINIRFEEK